MINYCLKSDADLRMRIHTESIKRYYPSMEKYLHSKRAVSSQRSFYLFCKCQDCMVNISKKKKPYTPLLYLPSMNNCFELTFNEVGAIAFLCSF